MNCALEHFKFELLGGKCHWILQSVLHLLALCIYLVHFILVWPVPPTIFYVLKGEVWGLMLLYERPHMGSTSNQGEYLLLINRLEKEIFKYPSRETSYLTTPNPCLMFVDWFGGCFFGPSIAQFRQMGLLPQSALSHSLFFFFKWYWCRGWWKGGRD